VMFAWPGRPRFRTIIVGPTRISAIGEGNQPSPKAYSLKALSLHLVDAKLYDPEVLIGVNSPDDVLE
jgi:hypothetical protein